MSQPPTSTPSTQRQATAARSIYRPPDYAARQAAAWGVYGPPLALRHARVLILVLAVWSLVSTLLILVAWSVLRNTDVEMTRAVAVWFGLSAVMFVAQALFYLYFAGKVRNGVSWAVTTMRVLTIVGLVFNAIELIIDPSEALWTLLSAALGVWLLVYLYDRQAQSYISWRRHNP